MTDKNAHQLVGIDEQIKCVEDELRRRKHFFKSRVGSGEMTSEEATREYNAMRAVRLTCISYKTGNVASAKA